MSHETIRGLDAKQCKEFIIGEMGANEKATIREILSHLLAQTVMKSLHAKINLCLAIEEKDRNKVVERILRTSAQDSVDMQLTFQRLAQLNEVQTYQAMAELVYDLKTPAGYTLLFVNSVAKVQEQIYKDLFAQFGFTAEQTVRVTGPMALMYGRWETEVIRLFGTYGNEVALWNRVIATLHNVCHIS